MKKLSIALLSLGLAASCSSSKTDTQPDETITETDTTETTESGEMASPDAMIVAAHEKYSAGDMEGTLAYFTEDSTWEEVGGPSGSTAEMLGAYKGMMSDMAVAPRRIFVAKDAGITVTQGVFKATNDGPMADGTPATNKPVGNDYLHIQWWNEDGKITKTWSIGNGTTVPKMAGLMPVQEGMRPPATSAWPGEPEVVMASENQPALDLVAAQLQAAVTGDLDTWAGNMADDYTGASFGSHNLAVDKPSAVAWMESMHKSFSEGSAQNLHAWSFGDYVVTVDKVLMKHTGDMGPMKATNKVVSQHFVSIDKVADGKIVWGASYSNPVELMMQLMPPKDATAMK